MRVAQISFYADPQHRTPEQLLSAWPSLSDVAECASRAGAEVSVYQASQQTQSLVHRGVRYHFLPFGAACADQANAALTRLLNESNPGVLHIHGLDFAHDVAALASAHPDRPILLQDHAARVPRIWKRAHARRGFEAVDGVAFCAGEQARAFVAAGLIRPDMPIFEIPESTSRFTPGDRAAARTVTGIDGDPAILWVGHLNANKDPLTILRGVRLAARALPDLRLHYCFGDAPLLPELRRRIDSDPMLEGRVRLRGRVPHAYVESLMRAADLFVLGSHREGSGYALIEALACGLPPVVTDIPSFRVLTGNGTAARLWPRGDAAALARALIESARQPYQTQRTAVRGHFDAELSSGAVGGKLFSAYTTLVSRRNTRRIRGA